MADKNTMSLGDLQKLMLKYIEELDKAKTKTTKAIKKDGTTLDVSQTTVSSAADALRTAETAVASICDQATLAIVVE